MRKLIICIAFALPLVGQQSYNKLTMTPQSSGNPGEVDFLGNISHLSNFTSLQSDLNGVYMNLAGSHSFGTEIGPLNIIDNSSTFGCMSIAVSTSSPGDTPTGSQCGSSANPWVLWNSSSQAIMLFDQAGDAHFARNDGAFLTVDASSNARAGITKPIGSIPLFTHGAGTTFEIARSSAADIGAGNTFTNEFAIDGFTGAFTLSMNSSSGAGVTIVQSGSGSSLLMNSNTSSASLSIQNNSGQSIVAFSSSATSGTIEGTSTTGIGVNGNSSSGDGIFGSTATGQGGVVGQAINLSTPVSSGGYFTQTGSSASEAALYAASFVSGGRAFHAANGTSLFDNGAFFVGGLDSSNISLDPTGSTVGEIDLRGDATHISSFSTIKSSGTGQNLLLEGISSVNPVGPSTGNDGLPLAILSTSSAGACLSLYRQISTLGDTLVGKECGTSTNAFSFIDSSGGDDLDVAQSGNVAIANNLTINGQCLGGCINYNYSNANLATPSWTKLIPSVGTPLIFQGVGQLVSNSQTVTFTPAFTGFTYSCVANSANTTGGIVDALKINTISNSQVTVLGDGTHTTDHFYIICMGY